MERNSNNKRATNFTTSEENMLILLIKKYSGIIENKKTDSCMNQKKAATWLQITKEFNSVGGDTHRSIQILKNKYLNLKKKSLKKFSNEKKETYLTGGGPHVFSKDSEIDNNIREIIGSRISGFSSELDNDSADQEITSETVDDDISDEDITGLGETEELTVIFDDENKSDGNFEIDEIDKNGRLNYATASSSKSLNIRENNNFAKNCVDSLRTPVSTKLQVNNPKDKRKRGLGESEELTVIFDDGNKSNGNFEIDEIDKNGRLNYATASSSKSLKIQENNNFTKNCVSSLRTPVSTKLQVNNPKDKRKRDNTLKTKLSTWATSKQNFLSVQQQCLLDETKQKLKHNEEIHREELKQKRETHEMLREEHEIKMSILKLEKQKLIKEMSE